MASLARSSLSRLFADCAGLVFGLTAAVLTARLLGPSGKGSLSALTFLAGLFVQGCSIGLGDAAVVLIGRKVASLQEALSASIAAILISALVGMAGFLAVCAVQFRPELHAMSGAILATCLSIPLGIFFTVLGYMLSSQERIVAGSVALLFTSGTTTLGIWLFISVFALSVLGGALAVLVGYAVGLAIVIALLSTYGLSFRPKWSGRYLAPALRYGFAVQASQLIVVAAGRIDLLLVYALNGQAAAGHYSVALTLGALAGMVPMALSHASFSRLANLEEREALHLAVRLFKCGVIAAFVSSALLACVIPLLVPVLFGPAYAPAIGPAMIMLAGGIIASGQWLLCRAALARGRSALLSSSFGASLVLMCLLDIVLLPIAGLYGAAIAAVAGPVAGLGIALGGHLRSQPHVLKPRDFVPSVADLSFLANLLKRFAGLDAARPAPQGTPLG